MSGRAFVLGVDPGLSGAYALVSPCGALVEVDDLPVLGSGPRAAVNSGQLADVLRRHEIGLAVIEFVHAMPKQGVSSTFRFGYAAGQIRGVIDALDIPLMWTTPAQWKRSVGVTADGETSRARAIETWPEMRAEFARKKDHNRAEAALIARFGVPYFVSGLMERAA
jgi:crossover junction endodeoxyribonuclease RuvC